MSTAALDSTVRAFDPSASMMALLRYRKLGVKGRAEAIYWMAKRGYIR